MSFYEWKCKRNTKRHIRLIKEAFKHIVAYNVLVEVELTDTERFMCRIYATNETGFRARKLNSNIFGDDDIIDLPYEQITYFKPI